MNPTVQFNGGNASKSSLPFSVMRMLNVKRAISCTGDHWCIDSMCQKTGKFTASDNRTITFKAMTGFGYGVYQKELLEARLDLLPVTPTIDASEPITYADIDKAKRLVRDKSAEFDLADLGDTLVGRMAVADMLGYLPLPALNDAYRQTTWDRFTSEQFMATTWLRDALDQANKLDAELCRLTAEYLPESEDFIISEPVVLNDIQQALASIRLPAYLDGKRYHDLVLYENTLRRHCLSKLATYESVINQQLYVIDIDMIPALFADNPQMAKRILKTHFHSREDDFDVLEFYWPAILSGDMSPTVAREHLRNDRAVSFINLPYRHSFQAACANFHANTDQTYLSENAITAASQAGLSLTVEKETNDRWWWVLSDERYAITALSSSPWDTDGIRTKAMETAYENMPAFNGF